jgi:hypothetical protein
MIRWTHSNHESWCAHKGLLSIWLMGLETNAKNATLTIETTVTFIHSLKRDVFVKFRFIQKFQDFWPVQQ